MKFRFLALLALVLGLASCQKDTYGLDVDANGEAAVTISVALPDVETRAGGNDSAIGAFGNVDFTKYDVRYILEVYNLEGQLKDQLAKERIVNTEDEAMETSFTLRLIPGRGYRFVVWADLVLEDSDDDLHYVTTDLKDIQLKNLLWKLSDETRDAYTGTWDEETFNSTSNIRIELKRPLGKLRVVTTDIKDMFNVLPEEVTVEYTSSFYTKFNAFTSQVVSDSQGMALKSKTIKISENKYTNEWNDEGKVKENLTLFADYYFATNEQEPISFTLDVKDNNGMAIPQVVFNTNIPIQRNYLTTVMGPVLTDANSITVVVNDAFDGYYNVDHPEGDITFSKPVSTQQEFNEAFEDDSVHTIILTEDIVINESLTRAGDYTLTVSKNKALTIDLNGKTLSSTSSQTGTNYNMFDVRGTLTVKNGTITTKHEGENMAWGNSTNVFNVTDGGVLNLEGVNAKNLGGSDMAFVAHLNNWGEVTLNVENSTLESTYTAVRVFNSGNHMNNVTIKNSTLDSEGAKTFWVHNYTLADYGNDAAKTAAHQALLNFDIFNGTNTFKSSDPNRVIEYGFTNYINFDGEGNQIISDAAELAAALTADKENISVVLVDNIELPITSLGEQTGGSGEYKLGGESTKAITIDLNDKKLNITTTYWSAIGAKNNNALFTIKNGTMTSTGNSAGTWNAWDIRLSNCNYAIEDVTIEKAVALDNVGKSTSMKNVTITDNHNTDTYGLWITAEGQTVTLDGCVIDMTPASDGRGIKIDNQYVAAGSEKKVTLNVANTTFKTDEKAAILVKNPAGADINLKNINIAAVAADSDFAVWVDEDAAAYADLVTVTGGLKKVEGTGDAVVGSQDDFAAAVVEGATIYLNEGTFIIPSSAKGKTVTFIGAGDPEDTQVAVTKVGTGGENCDYGLDGSTVTFENITITTNSSTYIGYARCNGTYKNCIINGTYTLYGNSVFENCTFNVSGDVYNIWTWGAPTATFTNCTFNCDGKAMLLYGTVNTKLTMNNCVFNDKGGLADLKAAIEIGNDYNKSYELIVNKATVNGFEINDKGINTGTTLWANKNSMGQDKLNVVVDGVDVY